MSFSVSKNFVFLQKAECLYVFLREITIFHYWMVGVLLIKNYPNYVKEIILFFRVSFPWGCYDYVGTDLLILFTSLSFFYSRFFFYFDPMCIFFYINPYVLFLYDSIGFLFLFWPHVYLFFILIHMYFFYTIPIGVLFFFV